jgi:CTP synthase (UTP-ammonia lyase)
VVPEVAVLIDRRVAGPFADATIQALHHAADHLDLYVRVREVPTATIDRSVLASAGVVVGPGSPYDDPEAVLDAIGSARERGVPLVGT